MGLGRAAAPFYFRPPRLHFYYSWRSALVMAVKSKVGTARVQHVPGKPKRTRQGQGQHSLPNHGRKKTRGQGR